MRQRTRLLKSFLTPSLVVGTFLSIIAALLMFVFEVTDFGVSFLIALSGMTLAAVIDVIDRNEYAALFKAPLWIRHEVARFGSLAQEVLDHGREPLEDELKDVIEQALADVEVVASGRIERDASDTRLMLEMAIGCEKRLAATTNVAVQNGANRLTWWQSEFGRRYWDANQAALRRGVRIDRIFIYEKMDAFLRALADEQRRAGVNVYLIGANEVAGPYRINSAVFDDLCCWEAKMDAYSNITANLFSYSKVDLKRLTELVDTLVLHAQLPSDETSQQNAGDSPDTLNS